MRVEILSSSLPSCYQPQMISPQTSRVRRRQQAIYEHGERYPPFVDRIMERYSLFCLIPQAVSKACKGKEDTKEGSRAYKGKEIPIISSPNAIIDPYTMMVLCFYATVTNSAMMTSRRPPNITCLTVLSGNVHGAIRRPSRLDRGPLCCWWPQREWVFGVLRGRQGIKVSRQYLLAIRGSFL